MALQSDELFGAGWSQMGPPSAVEIADEDWDADEYMKLGALKRDSAYVINGVETQQAELFGGQSQGAWMRAIHGSKVRVSVDVIEYHSHLRAMAMNRPLNGYRIDAGGTFATLNFGAPGEFAGYRLKVPVPIYSNRKRVVTSKNEIWYLHKARVVNQVTTPANAETPRVTTLEFEGEGDVDNSDNIGKVTAPLKQAVVTLTETAGDASGKTITSANLANYTLNSLVGWYVEPLAGANAGQGPGIVKSNDPDTTKLVINGSFPNAILASPADTFELYQLL